MVPGKQYSIEDYLRIAWRRKWLVAGPFVLVSVVTAVVAWNLPNRYRAEAVLQVVPQRVPTDYVQPTVTSLPDERLRSLYQQILSRTRLEQIMREFDLYADERRTMIMEDVIQRMRREITIDIPQRNEATAAFRVSYIGSDARTVTRVTERLTSLFIEENLRDRERLAEGTDQFLDTQLQEARGRLIEQEKKLEEYRRAHAGELPSQVQSNLQVVQNAQLQVQAIVQSIAQDRDRKLMLERLLSDAEAAPPLAAAQTAGSGEGTPGAPAGATAAQQLEAARAMLRGLELRLKEEHPDIQRLKRTIAELEVKADEEALARPISADDSLAAAATPAEAARLARIRDMRLEIESLDRQIAQKLKEEERLRGVSAEYQRRLAAAPTRESELIELTRDHDTLLNLYTNLLAKKENARMAVNMERRQIGEQFRIIDPARLPERPFSPNRPQIYAMGLLGGLLLGFGLVALVEYRDTSLRSEADVVTSLALPVLAMIPAMTTAAERRRRRRRKLVLSLSAAGALALAMGGAAAWWMYLR